MKLKGLCVQTENLEAFPFKWQVFEHFNSTKLWIPCITLTAARNCLKRKKTLKWHKDTTGSLHPIFQRVLISIQCTCASVSSLSW